MNDQALNELINDVIRTHAFQRIRKVSFLGIVDTYASSHSPNYITYSRAEHSVGVLNLALRIASQLRLDDSNTAILAVSALVHDLAHPPFSHSLEYAFDSSQRKQDHHGALGKLLRGGYPYSGELIRTLERHNVDIERVYSTVSGHDNLSFFFFNPINIDTLDGISRPIWSEGHMASYNIGLISTYIASIFDGNSVREEEFFREADMFWKSKNNFYNMYLSGARATAEDNFQRAAREAIGTLDDVFFGMSDDEFLKRYPKVALHLDAYFPKAKAAQQIFSVDATITSVDRNSIYRRYKRVRSEDNRSNQVASIDRQSSGSL